MSSRINKPDTAADIQLKQCLDRAQSFIMIAGAGSGKTTSLVKALSHIVVTRSADLRKWGQKIACITYTEIAAKEIWNDVGNNPLVHVSTIHSFLWSVISPYQKDIKKWVIAKIASEIEKLEATAAAFTARTGQNTRDTNNRKIQKFRESQETIAGVRHFIYGTGRDFSKGILGHDDIITMVPQLLVEKPLLRSIVAQSYPVVFIDESQDTFPDVVAAFKSVTSSNPKFCLGFFGDPMQKIYLTGVGDIPLEEGWLRIAKPENFRCSTSVINTINRIRSEADGLVQVPGENNRNKVGSSKIFILPADQQRTERLSQVKQFIARTHNDPVWNSEDVKLLVIVHRMAATRLKFGQLYSAMHDNAPQVFKDGLLDGTAWPLKPFLNFVLPLVEAWRAKKNFDVVEILREKSPLFEKDQFKNEDVAAHLGLIKAKVEELTALFDEDDNIGSAITFLKESKLYALDQKFVEFLTPQDEENAEPATQNEGEQNDDNDAMIKASIEAFFDCPLKDLWGYRNYIDEQSPFATQHGVKGTEYERVITICDDDEGTHNLFSYDRYFGVAALSPTDVKNAREGKENSVDRTRRLFYVCCSRAETDLAVIYFVANPDAAVENVRNKGIFRDEDIFRLADIQV